MTEARAEIALKFSAIPPVREIPNGRVEFDLTAPNGIVFTARIKTKTWRKSETSMREYEHWVAPVGGKLGNPTALGFELTDAGLQVYEKKPKPSKATHQSVTAH